MRNIVSIGNFDGLHRGHRKLISSLVSIARHRDLHSVVISYTTHPAFTLRKDAPPLILTPASRKAAMIRDLGVNEVVLLPFDDAFSKVTADQFLHDVLMPRFSPVVIVVGYDSHFGFQRRGTHEFLRSHSQQYGFTCEYIEPCLHNGIPVSSSMIRNLLLSGDLQTANMLLEIPYAIDGTVVPGAGLGTGLGFPTANLNPDDPCQLIPKHGIYLSRVRWQNRELFGLTNIGLSPTLKKSSETEVETYIMDFSENLTGTRVSLELLEYFREERHFHSRDELITAMRDDEARARSIISGNPS
jgi:riboflavin kinase/FMN adenylyltransferase